MRSHGVAIRTIHRVGGNLLTDQPPGEEGVTKSLQRSPQVRLSLRRETFREGIEILRADSEQPRLRSGGKESGGQMQHRLRREAVGKNDGIGGRLDGAQIERRPGFDIGWLPDFGTGGEVFSSRSPISTKRSRS